MSNEKYYFGVEEIHKLEPNLFRSLSDEDKAIFGQIMSNRFNSDQSEAIQELDYVFIKKLHTEDPNDEVLIKVYNRLTKINNVGNYDGFNTILEDDDLENSEKQINFTLNYTKDEIRNVLLGKIEIRGSAPIQAAAAYLRGNVGIGNEGARQPNACENKTEGQKLEDERECLEKYISQKNIWFDNGNLGIFLKSGSEQGVYRYGAREVIKLNRLNTVYYNSWLQYFYSLLLHNYFFQDTPYELIGFTKHNGQLNAVVKQRFIHAPVDTNVGAIIDFMYGNGFSLYDAHAYINEALGITIKDLHDKNVLTTKDYTLYFVDTICYASKDLLEEQFDSGGNLDELNNLEAIILKGRQDYQTRGALTVIKWLRANENPNDAQNTNIVLNELKSAIRELGPSVRQIKELFVREPEMKDNSDMQETVDLYNAYNRIQELYDAWLLKQAAEFDYSILFNQNETESEPKVSQEETKAADREAWYQKSGFSKRWAPTYKAAVEKATQQYFDAKKEKETWEAKVYKKAKCKSVFVGDELSGSNVSVNYINDKKKANAIRGAAMTMKESMETLRDLGLGKEELSDLLSPKIDEDTNFCMLASEKSLAKEWDPESLKIIDLEQEAIHRYQWMRNKEGGQEYGNQEIIVPENEARYLEFRHLLKDKKMSFADYQKKFGQAYMRYIRMNNKGEWKFHNLNSLDKLKPEQQYFDNGWVIEVTDFNSPEAIKQGSTADSEINVVAGAEAAIGVLEGVITPNMKPTPKFPHGKELLDMTVAQINEAQGMLSSYYWDNFISPKEAEIKDLQFRSKLLPARSPEKAKMKDQILDLQSEVAVYNSESRKTFVDSWIAMSNYLMHWTVSSGLVDKVDKSDMEEYFSDMLGDLSMYTFEREREMTWDQKLIDVWLDIVRDHFVNGEKIKLGENYQVPTVVCPLADNMEVPVPVASFVNYMLREGKACKLISAGYNTAPIEDILPCWTVHFECIQPLTQREILTAFENNVKVIIRGKGNYDIYFLLPYKIGPGEASAVKQYLNALEIALARDEFYDLESKGYEDKLKWFAKDLKELKSASAQVRYEREKMLYIDASTSYTKAQLIIFFDTQPNGVEFNANLHGKLVGEWQRSVPGRLRKVDGVYDILRLEGNNVTTLQYGPAFELVDLIFKGEVVVLTEKSPMFKVSVEEKNAVQELPAVELPATKISIEFDVSSEDYGKTTCVISDLASAIERAGCSCADGNDYHFNEYELDQLREILETGETQTFVPVANLKYPLNWVAKMKVEGNLLKLPPERMSTSEYNDVKRILLKSEGVYKKNAFEFEEPAIDVYLRILGGEEYNMRKKYQYYGTPAATGDYMVKLAEIECGMSFLEPSAGRAALMNAIWRVCPEAKIDYFEAMPTNLKVLKELSNEAFLGEDFLKIKTSKKYDRIIANPPFSKDQDQAHIRLMFEFLAPKGRLITVSSTHWQFATDKHSTAFREWIAKIGARVIDVPAGTFKESGTMVPTVIIVADKK